MLFRSSNIYNHLYTHLLHFQSFSRLGAPRPGTSSPRLSESIPPTTYAIWNARMRAYCYSRTVISTPQTHDYPSTSASLIRLSMAISTDQISRSAPPSARPDLESLVGHGSDPPTTPPHEAEMDDSDAGSPRRAIGSRSSGDGAGPSCRCSPTPSFTDSSGRALLRQVILSQFGMSLTVLLQ